MTPLYRKFALYWLVILSLHVAWFWGGEWRVLWARDLADPTSRTADPSLQTPPNTASVQVAGTDKRSVAFWVVSSRGLSRTQIAHPKEAIDSLAAYASTESGILQPARIAELEKTLKDAVGICLVVHGNRMEMRDAVAFMQGFQRALGKTDRALVLWSWPSDPQTRGLRRDSRLKAVRSEAEGDLLAAWLGRAQPKGQLVLVGYSFGAKMILHAMAAALSRESDPTETNAPEQAPVTVLWGSSPIVLMLIAAAAEQGELEQVLDLAEDRGVALRAIITINRRDPALKWYQHLWTCRGPVAIGWIMPCLEQDSSAQQAEFVDVTGEVGHTHRWQAYWCSSSVRRVLKDLVSPSEKAEESARAAR